MRGSGGADVQQMSRRDLIGIHGLGDFGEDDESYSRPFTRDVYVTSMPGVNAKSAPKTSRSRGTSALDSISA